MIEIFLVGGLFVLIVLLFLSCCACFLPKDKFAFVALRNSLLAATIFFIIFGLIAFFFSITTILIVFIASLVIFIAFAIFILFASDKGRRGAIRFISLLGKALLLLILLTVFFLAVFWNAVTSFITGATLTIMLLRDASKVVEKTLQMLPIIGPTLAAIFSFFSYVIPFFFILWATLLGK